MGANPKEKKINHQGKNDHSQAKADQYKKTHPERVFLKDKRYQSCREYAVNSIGNANEKLLLKSPSCLTVSMKLSMKTNKHYR